MKLKGKFITSVLVSVLLVTSLTGCKSSPKDTKNEPKDVQATTENIEKQVKEGGETNLVPSKPTEVIFWHSISGDKELVLKEIVDDYNAGPGAEKGIEVTPIFQGSYEDFSTKLAAALQAKDLENIPDIVQLSSKGIFDVKDSEFMYPVQNLINLDPNGIDTSTFNAASAAYCTYDNKLLGVPFSTSSIMMYYNKDHFREAGLDAENPPKTIAELADAVDKLTVRKGDKIERYGLGTQLRFFVLGTWIPSLGSEYAMFNNDNGRTATPTEITMTKDGSLEKVLTEWKKVLDTKGVEYTDAKPNEAFQSGYYSIMFASTSSLSSVILNAVDTGTMDLGVAEIVRVDENGSAATGIGGSALYMFNRGNQDTILGTWDFFKYLATPEASAKWYAGTGYYPMNTAAFDMPEVVERVEKYPQYKIIDTIIENSAGFTDYTEPWIPAFSDTDTLIQDEIIKFSDGSQDLKTTIENCEVGATQKLNDYLSANQ